MEISEEQAKRLAEEIAKLAKETARLRGDVRRVARVFFPKLDLEAEDVHPGPLITLPVKTASDLLARLRLHRLSLEDSQAYVAALEAHMKTVRDNVGSRSDWEHFLTAQSSSRRHD